jgi:septum formation protein
MLQQLRGQKHRVFSGLCLWPINLGVEPSNRAGPNDAPQTHLAVTELRMDPISTADLDDYLASGLWQGKAGAFGYQDRHGWLSILQGSESNVIGLPMELLVEQLGAFEIE